MMSENQGDKGSRVESGLTLRADAQLERLAIAKGWLKNAKGDGLDTDKLATLIERNYQRAMATDDDRALASLTRNVQTAVGHVMEQEKRDSGGDTLTVNLTAMTEDEKKQRLVELLARGRERRLALPDGGGTNGSGHAGGLNGSGH
jgi:hypothetical protein